MGSIEERARLAAEQVIGDSSLTDEMDDAEASALLDWAAGLARQAAAQTLELDDAAASEILAARMQDVRRLVRRINRLIGLLGADPSDEEVEEALRSVFESASAVPGLTVQLPMALADSARLMRGLPAPDALGRILSHFTDWSGDGEAT